LTDGNPCRRRTISTASAAGRPSWAAVATAVA
jgi:hypothetical protein